MAATVAVSATAEQKAEDAALASADIDADAEALPPVSAEQGANHAAVPGGNADLGAEPGLPGSQGRGRRQGKSAGDGQGHDTLHGTFSTLHIQCECCRIYATITDFADRRKIILDEALMAALGRSARYI
jgi:hypothetical protein